MRHPDIIKRLVVLLAKHGVPYANITRETGLPASTMSKWGLKHGVRRHKSPIIKEDNNLKLF